MSDLPDITPDHDARGKFKPGNKAGRKKSRRAQTDTASAYMRSLLARCEPKDIEKITSALCIEAASGNVPAAKEVLDRLLGKTGDKPLQLVLLELREFDPPAIEGPADLLAATQTLLDAVARNKADERRATKLAALLDQQRRNIETVSLQDRVDALERLIRSRALPTEGDRLRHAMTNREGGETDVPEGTFETVGA